MDFYLLEHNGSKFPKSHQTMSYCRNASRTLCDIANRGNSVTLKTIRKPFTHFITVCYIWDFQQVEVKNL